MRTSLPNCGSGNVIVGAQPASFAARHSRDSARHWSVALSACCLIVAAAGCSRSPDAPRPVASINGDRRDGNIGTSPSERVVLLSQPVPRGGGTYKLGEPYKVSGRWYVPKEEPGYDRTGIASWYGADFHGRRTANGEVYDMNALTAAHPTLPLPSLVYVTSLKTGRTILVRVNDRGPYAADRILDLSKRAADSLGISGAGVSLVRVRYAGRAPLNGDDLAERRFLASQPWSQRNIARNGQLPQRMALGQ
jgi:peptidoglycan lytic transglycosylase